MKHYPDDFLSQQRLEGDPLADSLINEVFADADNKASFYNLLNSLTDNSRLSVIASGMTDDLFAACMKLPDWADARQMENGTAFFARYAELIMNLLALLSLPYCYAGANGAMVLFLSDKIRGNIEQRLYDTAGFVWDVMAPNAFQPDGKGFVSILKVRLMHAAARYYTTKSDNWNGSFGTPVNQEDMAGTNLSFSLIVIRGLRKLGISVNEEEQSSFLHLWSVIGFMLGVNEPLLPQSGKQAFDLEEAIRNRQFRTSEQGIALTSSLTQFLKTAVADAPVSNQETLQLMRYLLGDEIADMIDLPPVRLSAVNLNFIQLGNSFKYLRPEKDIRSAYRREHKKFKEMIK
jgi:hypothetical protein